MATRVILEAGWREWLKRYLRFYKFKKNDRNIAIWARENYKITAQDNLTAVRQLAVILLDKQEKGFFKEVTLKYRNKIKSKRCLVVIPDKFGEININCKYAKTENEDNKFIFEHKAKKEGIKQNIPTQKKDKQNIYDFYETWEWKTLRYKVLKKYGAKCMLCGRGVEDGVKIFVDHIKPRALFPELELEESNLQVLCNDCNMGKGRWDDTDWRKKPQSDIKIRKIGKE